MLGTDADLLPIIQNYLTFRHCVTLSITSKCPFTCEHCCQSASMDGITMSIENITKIISQLDKTWFLEIMGGEAFLEPELLQQTINLARKKGVLLALDTTGYWVNDDKLCNIAKQADFLILSMDPWHRKAGIPMETVDKVCEKFMKEKVKILGNFLINTLDESTPKHKFAYIKYPFLPMGRAKNLMQYKKNLYANQMVECDSCGVFIESNGNIHGNCIGANNACPLGHIDNVDINKLVTNFKKVRYDLKGTVTSCWEICQSENFAKQSKKVILNSKGERSTNATSQELMKNVRFTR